MAKTIPLTLQKKAENARVKLIRYIAITGICEYSNVSEFSSDSGFRMMDATECTKYYIDKGWMRGKPLKNYGASMQACQMKPFYQSAVIACTSTQEAYKIIKEADGLGGSHYFFYRRFNKDYCNLTYSLNVYCQAHPETLAMFGDMGDFPVHKPTEKESQSCLELWNNVKEVLSESLPKEMDISYLVPLIKMPQFKEFFQALPYTCFEPLLDTIVSRYQYFEFVSQEDYDYLYALASGNASLKREGAQNFVLDRLLFYQHFLRHGDIAWHKQRMHEGTSSMVKLSALEALQEDRASDAMKLIESSFKKNKAVCYDEPVGDYIYGLSIYLSKSAASQKRADVLLKKKLIKENETFPHFRLLLQMAAHPETDFEKWIPFYLKYGESSRLASALFFLLCTHFGYVKDYEVIAKSYGENIIEADAKVLALDFANDDKSQESYTKSLMEITKMKPLLPAFKKLEPWEVVINAMLQKYDVSETSTTRQKSAVAQEVSRVSYLLNTNNYDVQPRLQKSKDGGITWSGGRNIAMKNFQKGIPEMTAQDARVAMLVETYDYGWYGGTSITLGGADVVEALIGHPYVYDSFNSDIKIEIQAEKLQIQVKEVPAGYKVSANVSEESGLYHTINVQKESAQLIKVIRLSSEEKDILSLFNRIGTFPKAAKEQLTKLLSALGRQVTVMSPLLKNTAKVKTMKGDSKLTVQLVPYGELFTTRCFVKPLTTCPPYCTPGKGLEFIASNVKGKTVQVNRNLTAEKKNYKEFCRWMEPFDEYESGDGWQVPIESCLEVLDLLRQHTDVCSIEWPEGVKLSVSHPALSSDSIHLSVKGIGHWFEVDGEIDIDDKQKIKVDELLKRVREAKGRFIQIGDAEYMALSHQLQKQLSALDHLMQTDHKKLKIATYNSSFLKDIADAGADLKVDKTYKEMMKRMEEADTMKVSIPKNLQAELRDYQTEGFRWLMRLAHWGAGACLADDMGLGKTIQTIALLLSKANEGASLVVMPTSVLINWKNEFSRFAPSLNTIILRDASNREETVKNAGPGDVVLITYGLLPTEEDTLKSKQWNVIVLDEAHTIKNKETKTSKAAMQLDGKFRLLLTGTPLQNHLSEIWNLFQFATPGLLTGYTQFTQEFINPIEKDNNKDTQKLLKHMLQPFILRRTKNEVLDELPQKTEITLKVELSETERVLYDRFRQEAVLNLEEGSSSAIKALAELTRLRQAACNAALVLPANEAKDIPSSKMEAFLKLVEELINNHHRALVFSQFTSHLALVEKELKRLKIDYEYLDGSVTPTERIARVAKFQKGDMPLFLISLKAGGIGLNLTAADFVIHLDPWWNPAIEDQASDRAYRIGQDKPVTVYRLIAENTIEEKIIALHKSKKSLADALLEGSDMASTLNKDEILNLIRGIE